jgi:hypothetical protein
MSPLTPAPGTTEVVADPKRPWKAVTSGVVYAGGWLTVVLADGVISQQEWIGGVVGLVVSLGAVFSVTNPKVAKKVR